MGRIIWDAPGVKRYEFGVDRGVLYLPDGSGVAWNGLTSVEEDLDSAQVTPYHFDGVKYLEIRSTGDLSATIRAFTYPEEFEQFDGLQTGEKGIVLTNQPVTELFGLSYRTKVGSDASEDEGYKIHLLYNLTAAPDNRSYLTLGAEADVSEFAWTVTGVPEVVSGYKPTAHVILDTSKMNRFLINDLENLLYGRDLVELPNEVDVLDGGSPSSGGDVIDSGTVGSTSVDKIDGGAPFSIGPIGDGEEVVVSPPLNPRLPSLEELMSILSTWLLISITDHGDGTWTAIAPDELVTFINDTTFQIDSVVATYLDDDTYVVSDTHSF